MCSNIFRFDKAKWNVSGLFTHDSYLLYFYDILSGYGTQPLDIVHGCIPCAWNSGRIIKSKPWEYIEHCFEEYARRNIAVYLTFSNYKVGRELLNDRDSNRILEICSMYDNNGAIVGNDLLADYIRNNYPKMKLCTSILKTVNDNGKGEEGYYEELLSKFDKIVLHPDDSYNYGLLNKIIHKKNVEIIVNEDCVRGCVKRKEHCDIVCDFYSSGRIFNHLDALTEFKRSSCKSVQNKGNLGLYLNNDLQNCNLTYEEMEKVYSMGYQSFKIQGRSSSPASVIYDMSRYILTEGAAAMVFKLITNQYITVADSDKLIIFSDKLM